MSVRKATFTMEHVNITICLCCCVWCALHVIRKGNIILSGLSISTYDCNIYNGCEGGHRDYPGNFNSYIWHNHRCHYKHKLEHYHRKWRWQWHIGTRFYRHTSVTWIKKLYHVTSVTYKSPVDRLPHQTLFHRTCFITLLSTPRRPTGVLAHL